MPDANEWIDTVIKRSAELRKAGVTTIAIEGCSVTLAPPPAETDHVDGKDQPPESSDPLFSAATYPNGVVPGFTRETP